MRLCDGIGAPPSTRMAGQHCFAGIIGQATASAHMLLGSTLIKRAHQCCTGGVAWRPHLYANARAPGLFDWPDVGVTLGMRLGGGRGGG